MTALAWTDDLALQHPQMDTTHQEFVQLLAAADEALALAPAVLLERFEALVAHTVEHFAQEDRWMQATGFAKDNCHGFQHQAVLGVMQECARRARQDEPDFEPLRLAVGELAIWFPQHAQMMDAALAQHLAAVGYDVATGECRAPALAEAITGCGSTPCATPAAG
ncbi:MAG: hemerythrin [Burkholderiales bacterium]|nr:hemerythrin [Burkholderiales bacterium]